MLPKKQKHLFYSVQDKRNIPEKWNVHLSIKKKKENLYLFLDYD